METSTALLLDNKYDYEINEGMVCYTTQEAEQAINQINIVKQWHAEIYKKICKIKRK